MESWPRLYPSACNCQGKVHKFFKNCTSCGLIFCQQNSKLKSCTFCSFSFDVEFSGPSEGLEKALNLQNRLLVADSSNSTATTVKEEFHDDDGTFLQTNFLPISEITSRRREIEDYKRKLEKEQEEKSTFNLSQMLNL